MPDNEHRDEGDNPEVGFGGHLKFTNDDGRGWLRDTNKKLDAWLEKRGLKNERTTPYSVFGEYGGKGPPPRPKSKHVPDAEQVSGMGERQQGERGDESRDDATRPVPSPSGKSQRKTKKRKKKKK